MHARDTCQILKLPTTLLFLSPNFSLSLYLSLLLPLPLSSSFPSSLSTFLEGGRCLFLLSLCGLGGKPPHAPLSTSCLSLNLPWTLSPNHSLPSLFYLLDSLTSQLDAPSLVTSFDYFFATEGWNPMPDILEKASMRAGDQAGGQLPSVLFYFSLGF